MKKLPIGIQSIDKILGQDEYVYVDKTSYIKHLIDGDSPHYFISRPRRFGKSLFISTLKEVFKGNRELFKGCQIYNSNYQWPKHPVLHFDFSRMPNGSPKELRVGLMESLKNMARQHGITIEGSSAQMLLQTLVEGLSKTNKVAILIDEYDHPIISKLNNLDIAEKNREELKGFFDTMKSLDNHIKFTFITGVSKFSQVSLFSALNNLTDITMSEDYAEVLGYTEEEVNQYFASHIQAIVSRKNKIQEDHTYDQVLNEIRAWYNSYRFSREKSSVYNPLSTLKYMKSGIAESYWYSTGTPSFLIQQIQQHPQAVVPLSGATALKSTLSDISNLNRINLTALMFQTGYLTITDYDQTQDFYCLDFPNQEVRQAFFNSLLEEFAEIDPTDLIKSTQKVQQSLNSHDIQSFVAIMNTHFGKIAYQLSSKANEGFYHAIFLTFLERSGLKTIAEVATNAGRIDLVTEVPKVTCIFELKLDQSAEIAFNQVEATKYRERYSHADKEIMVIGINFSSKNRKISEWKAKLFSPEGKELKDL